MTLVIAFPGSISYITLRWLFSNVEGLGRIFEDSDLAQDQTRAGCFCERSRLPFLNFLQIETSARDSGSQEVTSAGGRRIQPITINRGSSTSMPPTFAVMILACGGDRKVPDRIWR